MVKGLIRFFNLIHIVLVYSAQLLMIAMVLIIFANVMLRYIFNSGLMWSEELALLFAVWFIFIAMSIGVKQDLHINISVLPKKLVTPFLHVALEKIKNVIILIIALTMLVDGWKLVQFTLTSIMPATQLPAGLLYVILPISSIIIIYESLMDLFNVDTQDALVDAVLSGKGLFSSIFKGGANG